ncbi:MAG: hypothetical protein IKU49_07405 [Prevotella sp.]|nr:hypothetical protein [Prevotella sp.]
MHLPEDFIREMRRVMGEDRWNRFLEAFNEDAPTSIRLNPKTSKHRGTVPRVSSVADYTGTVPSVQQVPWCPEGFYLPGRPQFTFDPLFHAGCYYVQEASSMFITHVLRQFIKEPMTMLDLCAAPGGKSTAAITVLPEGSTLTSNEPIRSRYQILEENITKWGYANCSVTNLFPRDFRKKNEEFDVILCDVPCSGEGMFRKDPNAISEWSLQNVEKCWRLQREIVADAWECLNPGGILIYSTCTYNTKENEENVRFFMEEYDAEILSVPTESSWGITGSLLEGFDAPVYRFIPGFTRGEGLFMAVLRKKGTLGTVPSVSSEANYRGTVPSVLPELIGVCFDFQKVPEVPVDANDIPVDVVI